MTGGPPAPWIFNIALIWMLMTLGLASLTAGAADLGPGAVLAGLFGAGDEKAVIIVQEIRLPRAVLAALVGGSLGLAGAVLQGLLRNPLAEPGVVGVTSAAGLGAVIAIYFGFAAGASLGVPAAAMAAAAIATAVIFVLARIGTGTLTLVLAGIGLSSLAVALTSLVLALSPNPWALSEMVYWLMGSVRDRSFRDVVLILPFTLAGWLLLLSTARALDALTLGEDTARSLGVDLTNLQRRAIAGLTLCVGAGIAVTGSIGFVGLVVPHLLRPLTGGRPGALLLPSLIGGAILLVGADLAVRVIAPDRELYLGVATALLGAPFFLWLVIRTRRKFS